MAGNYQELYRLTPNLYAKGCAILIEVGVLQKNITNGNIFVQLKMKNISDEKILACKASFKAFEINGTEVEGVSKFSYLDVNAAPGQEFGQKVPVTLPDNVARTFNVTIDEIVFEGGNIWTAEQLEWETIPEAIKIEEEIKDIELLKQWNIETGNSGTYLPKMTGGLILCGCGALRLDNIDTCYMCQKKLEDITQWLDMDKLTEKKEVRVADELRRKEATQKAAAEEAERKRIEEEKRERERAAALEEASKKAEARKKKIKIGVVAIALSIVAIIAVFVGKRIIDEQRLRELVDNINVGDTIEFGSYEWRVLDKNGRQLLIISKDAVAKKPYNDTNVDVTWEKCTLRKWLNNDFIKSAFNSAEQSRIVTTSHGYDIQDKVFLLNVNEVTTYFESDSDRVCKDGSGGDCWWWLRAPNQSLFHVQYVRVGGSIRYDSADVADDHGAVRPALWINLE